MRTTELRSYVSILITIDKEEGDDYMFSVDLFHQMKNHRIYDEMALDLVAIKKLKAQRQDWVVCLPEKYMTVFLMRLGSNVSVKDVETTTCGSVWEEDEEFAIINAKELWEATFNAKVDNDDDEED